MKQSFFVLIAFFLLHSNASALECTQIRNECSTTNNRRYYPVPGDATKCACLELDQNMNPIEPPRRSDVSEWTQDELDKLAAAVQEFKASRMALIESQMRERQDRNNAILAIQETCKDATDKNACMGPKLDQYCHEKANAMSGAPANERQTALNNCLGSIQQEYRASVAGIDPARSGAARDPAAAGASGEASAKLKFTQESINGVSYSEPKKLRRGDEDFEFGEDPELNDTIGYSKFHSFCEGELPSGQMWEQSQAHDAGNYKDSMNEFLASAKEEFVEKHGTDGISLQDLQAWYKKYNDQIQDRGKAYTYCTALMGSLQGNVNYSEKNSGGNGGEYIVASATKPDLKCVTYMYETADFSACRAALNAFDAAFIAEQGMGVYQQFDFQSKNMDRQMDLQKKQMKGGTIDTTDALGVQKSATEDQADVAKQRAAFDAAKLGTLTMMLTQIPDMEKIVGSCKANASQSIDSVKGEWIKISAEFHRWTQSMVSNTGAQLAGLAGATPSQYQPDETTVDTACTAFYNKRGSSSVSVQILRNQEIKGKIKAEMVKAGVSMASHIAKAALLEKQADEIQDVMNSIKKFEPPPFPENQMTEMQVLECQANPSAPGCGTLNGPNARGFEGNGISLGSSQFATSDGEAIDLNDPNAQNNNSANSKTDRADRARRLGSAAGDAAAESGILNPVAAADVKKGGGNPGGGAGGGPGAAGAGAAGGAGGGKPGQGGASGYSGGSVSKVNYKGAGGGSLNYSGGFGAARKPAAKADNPFANLLGKGGSKSGVLDGFRGPASGIGNKDDGLFQMISNRYSRISSDKDRLMQYEIKK